MYRIVLLSLAVALAAGCGFLPAENTGDPNSNANRPAESSALKSFQSQEEFQAYFGDQVATQNEGGRLTMAEPMRGGLAEEPADDVAFDVPASAGQDTGAALPAPSNAESDAVISTAQDSDGDFSTTTTQEAGVDEADVVKTDGDFLYVIDGERLHIVEAALGEELRELSSVSLEGYGQDIYLYANTVVAVTNKYGGYVYFDAPFPGGLAVDADVAIRPDANFAYERPKTMVTVFDVTDPANPAKLSATDFEGSITSSRMIDGVLHLVLANYQDYYYDIMPMMGSPEMPADELTLDAETLLPDFTRTDADGTVTKGNLVTWESLYRPETPDGFGMMTVVSLDVLNDAEFTAVGVVARPGLVYSSTDALYLTNTDYGVFGETRETTSVYKFDYVDGATVPVATGLVPGRILNQYSMGEYNGYLRVATTTGRNFFFVDGAARESTNAVYVLGEKDGVLDVVGSVEGIAPREQVQSARFMGDRGFVVTYEQVDPLFTLDLSDPTNPTIVGELKIPGFSTFIVPMDENHLLTVGQWVDPEGINWNRAVQLSIFDITDFAKPVRQHNLILGQDTGSYSDAIWNPKAFTYQASQGRIALPISIYGGFPFDPAVQDVFFDAVDGGFDDSGDPVQMIRDVLGNIVAGLDELLGNNAGQVDEPPATVAEPSIAPAEPAVDVMVGNDGAAAEPASGYIDSFDGLMLFDVSIDGGFQEVGRISTRPTEVNEYYWYFWPSWTRGVFIGSNVFAVTNLGVQSADLADIDGTLGLVMFEQPEIEYPDYFQDFVDDEVIFDEDPPMLTEEPDTAVSSNSSVAGSGVAVR